MKVISTIALTVAAALVSVSTAQDTVTFLAGVATPTDFMTDDISLGADVDGGAGDDSTMDNFAANEDGVDDDINFANGGVADDDDAGNDADAGADATAAAAAALANDADTVAAENSVGVGADVDVSAIAAFEVGAEAELDLTKRHSFTNPLVRQNVIMGVNKVRKDAGLAQVCLNYKLMNTAQSQANFQATTNTVTVTGTNSSQPSTRGVQAGFNATSGIGELVGAGYASADDLIGAWLKSDASKAILLGNYTHIGPGYTRDEKQQYVHYWAVDFATGVGEECSGLAA